MISLDFMDSHKPLVISTTSYLFKIIQFPYYLNNWNHWFLFGKSWYVICNFRYLNWLSEGSVCKWDTWIVSHTQIGHSIDLYSFFFHFTWVSIFFFFQILHFKMSMFFRNLRWHFDSKCICIQIYRKKI